MAVSSIGFVRIVFAVLAVAFFATPLALRAVGVTAEEFEKRRLADAPKLSQGWSAFDQTTRFAIDHMPLRADAVRLNTRIWTDVLGTDPPYARDTALAADRALPFGGAIKGAGQGKRRRAGPDGPVSARAGSAGWLFADSEFAYLCDDEFGLTSDQVAMQRWAQLVDAVRATGRDSAMFVVPEKASVYPEHLPDKYPFEDCALAAKERLWRTLAEEGPALDVHEVRSDMMRLKAKAGDGLFQRADQHWTTRGALVLVDAVLDRIGGDVRLKPSEIVERGIAKTEGDLSAARGRPEAVANREYAIVRARDAPRVPGRTLLICDSFVYKWMRLFKPYFEHVSYYSSYGMFGQQPELSFAIERADRIIFEAEEINLKDLAADGKNVQSLLADLRDDKPPPPGTSAVGAGAAADGASADARRGGRGGAVSGSAARRP